MSSAIFVKQLTDEQIMLFFEAIPFKKMEKSVMDDERIAVVLLPKKGSPLLYEIDDYEVVDHNIDKSKQISSEEWQIYLRGIFGEEYLNFLGYEDLPNPFINQLTLDEVKTIYSFGHPTKIGYIREVPSLLVGTRRFKIVPEKAKFFHEKDFILSPYMIYGYENFSPKSPEGKFLKFMVKKFGKEYIEYYYEIEQRIVEMDVKAYEMGRRSRAEDTIAYMEKVASKR